VPNRAYHCLALFPCPGWDDPFNGIVPSVIACAFGVFLPDIPCVQCLWPTGPTGLEAWKLCESSSCLESCCAAVGCSSELTKPNCCHASHGAIDKLPPAAPFPVTVESWSLRTCMSLFRRTGKGGGG
jgi:hypothetical protein